MNTENHNNNPMDDDYARDTSGCILVLGVCLALIVSLVLLIAFAI